MAVHEVLVTKVFDTTYHVEAETQDEALEYARQEAWNIEPDSADLTITYGGIAPEGTVADVTLTGAVT